MKPIVIVLAVVLIAGCVAPPPELTRQEYLALVNRTYESADGEEVLAAAEMLFRLADPDDVKFQHFDNGFRMYRPWSIYVVLAVSIGTDIWDVRVAPVEGGVTVTVHLSGTANTVTGAPVTTSSGATSVTALTIPAAGGIPVNSTAIYDLFWARLDYLLGRRTDWMTCQEANARVKAGLTYGPTDSLCSVTTDDLAPDSVSKTG